VTLQGLAVFVETYKGSALSGQRQIEIFKELHCPGIEFRLAIENASGLFEETGPLAWPSGLPPILYMSLTWNTENRFGGGALTSIGLKPDGKWLLRQMNEHGIAVDLSHTSDQLAQEILNEIDQNDYSMKVIASHSNARAICDVPRNLPDHLIREIVERKGLIGVNLYRKFLGNAFPDTLKAHIEHFRNLGAENCLVWGADFFYAEDLPPEYRQPEENLYFAEAANASCYPLLEELFDESFRRRIGTENFIEWEK
jgi:microsomal dipeptidase-like Zn-dependent dipeptidase